MLGPVLGKDGRSGEVVCLTDELSALLELTFYWGGKLFKTVNR